MNQKMRKLLADRAKLITDQRSILDKAEKEGRGLTADEETKYQNMDSEVEKLSRQIEKELIVERRGILEDREDVRSRIFSREDPREFLYGDGIDPGAPELREQRYVTPELRDALRRYLRQGVNAISHEEFRALQADADTAGGYLVLPLALVNGIVKAMDDEVFIRKLATIYPVPNAESLGVPSLDNDLGDPTWTAEIKTGSEDDDMSFGKRELTPHPIARLIKVSNKLMRAAYINAESLVTGRFVYKFGIVQEYAYLLGSGSNQPMGVFTAAKSGFGITAARDVSTGNTATAFTTDGLIEAFYSLKAQYRKKATWIFHRDAVKKIRKMKDGDGQYIWQLGISADKPPTILGAPYCESEYCPNTFTSGKYVGIVGDFSHYWIAESLAMKIQRLVELYAATNQVGFIGRQELDGMPVLEEAFARVKLA